MSSLRISPDFRVLVSPFGYTIPEHTLQLLKDTILELGQCYMDLMAARCKCFPSAG